MKRTTKAAKELIASQDFSLQSYFYQSKKSRVNLDALINEVNRLLLVASIVHENSN